MAFTHEQAQKIIETLQLKAANRICPLCGTKKWRLTPDVYMILIKDTLNSGQPCISLICEHCANVQLFDILALGLAADLGLGVQAEQAAEPDKKDG